MERLERLDEPIQERGMVMNRSEHSAEGQDLIG